MAIPRGRLFPGLLYRKWPGWLALLTCRHDHLRRRVRHRSGEDRRLRALRPAVDGASRPARRPPPRLLPARRGRERQGAGPVQLPQPRRVRAVPRAVRGAPRLRGGRPDQGRERVRAPLRADVHAPAAAAGLGSQESMASPMRCTRRAFVRPGDPGGLPATSTTRSPTWHRVISSRAASTWRTMSSVCTTDGTRKVSAPQVSASWLRVADSVVNASSGIGDRYLASRRAVSPVMVKATSALAATAP